MIKSFNDLKNPFTYDLGLKIIPAKEPIEQVMVCCHGYGDSNAIVDHIYSIPFVESHIISFNFPDFGITGESDHAKSSFGTIDELLPLAYVLKECFARGAKKIVLYGFSAGGGAVVNLLAVLNQARYEDEFKALGINVQIKETIMKALEQGGILLDRPLKSMEEIIDFRGSGKDFEILAQRYKENNLRPIDSVSKLENLSLNMIVHFQNSDDILSNRDDQEFIARLKAVESLKVHVVIGSGKGHVGYEEALWKAYSEKIKQ